MSLYSNTTEIKNAVLQKCGELTDGNSSYDELVVTYLNELYKGLMTGGNEFNVEFSEAWSWAKAKRPLILTLLPPYETGTVTLTEGSMIGTLSSAPSYSLTDWILKVESEDDYITIANHTASSTTIKLDQPYTDDTGTYNFKAIKVRYDLIDDTVKIDSSNNKIDFKESSGGSTLTATLTSGFYSITEFCAEVKAQLESAGASTYTVSFDTSTRKFTIATDGSYLSLLFLTGSNGETSCYNELGFNIEDQTGSTSYVSTYVYGGIERLIAPFRVYKNNSNRFDSANDIGKITPVDFTTFVKKYPINHILEATPDVFTIYNETKSGLLTVQFNAYVGEKTRVEIDYIPKVKDLVDSTYSYPLLPISFVPYLIFGASYYIMLDKSDGKAELNFNLAKAKLLAMINHNRSTTKVSGKNYGKIIPRLDLAKRIRELF